MAVKAGIAGTAGASGASAGKGRDTLLSRLAFSGDAAVGACLAFILAMMMVPLPTFVLDMLLAGNFALSLVIVLVSTYTLDPLQFSVFPSLLLVTTLVRLGLAVSATRLILLTGYAGKVIEAFGGFVVGGSYVVGTVVFLILVIIQFVVITNGAGRIAEVAARFTLDAMPGKQMSIDADLNAGLIGEDQARERRRAIEREADFYGAMDGATKFIRGDAVAAIIITLVNIVGGVIVGMLQLKLSPMEALQKFTLLTVGAGLAVQIPALLVSTATGIVVTRAASESNLGRDLSLQLAGQPRAVMTAAAILAGFGLVPGLPKLPFLGLALAVGAAAYALMREAAPGRARHRPGAEEGGPGVGPGRGPGTGGGIAGVGPAEEAEREGAPRGEARPPESVMSLLAVDPLEIEIGYGLFPLVDVGRGGDLLERATMVRRQIASELGLVIPAVRIRDNIQLKPGAYSIKIRGIEVARGEVMAGHFLAMGTGEVPPELAGIRTKDPVFGMPAAWITEANRERAEMMGFTVVDASSVVATHLTEVARAHAAELLGRQDTQNLLDNLKKTHPAVVADLVPEVMTLGEVQKVLQALLREGVSIRDLAVILEALGDHARTTRNLDTLTEFVRQALGRAICRRYVDSDGVLYGVTLDPAWEQAISEAVQHTDDGDYLAMEPKLAADLMREVARAVGDMAREGRQPVVLCSTAVRPYLKRLSERVIPGLICLSYSEVSPDTSLRTVGTVRWAGEDQ